MTPKNTQNLIRIYPLNALKDNYIWLIIHSPTKRCLIIDPGDATPVIQALDQYELKPHAILLTHHHFDHTAGIATLCKAYNIKVFGPATEEIPGVTDPLAGEQTLCFPELDISIQVMNIPGHTKSHLAFIFENNLFSGDTLFTGGCGRIFEGTAEQMYQSLAKLNALPATTLVYCGHEYTDSNLRFAEAVEPQNSILADRIATTRSLREKGLPTVPASLSIEQQTNPFLRCHIPSIKSAVEQHFGEKYPQPLDVFTALRAWKNNFVPTL